MDEKLKNRMVPQYHAPKREDASKKEPTFSGFNDDFLAHHGIPGQRWGDRRFQYKNGQLTPEGKIRYGKKSAEQVRAELDKAREDAQAANEKYLKKSSKKLFATDFGIARARKQLYKATKKASKLEKELKKLEEEEKKNKSDSDDELDELIKLEAEEALGSIKNALNGNGKSEEGKKLIEDVFTKKENKEIRDKIDEKIMEDHKPLLNKAYKEYDSFVNGKWLELSGQSVTEFYNEWYDRWGRRLCKELGIPFNNKSSTWIVSRYLFGDD